MNITTELLEEIQDSLNCIPSNSGTVKIEKDDYSIYVDLDYEDNRTFTSSWDSPPEIHDGEITFNIRAIEVYDIDGDKVEIPIEYDEDYIYKILNK